MANLIPTHPDFILTPAGGAMDSFVEEPPPDGDSPLALQCADLAAGELRYFATPGLFYTGASTTEPLYGVQWQNRWWYNNISQRAHQFGKNAQSQGLWRQNNLYDEQSNTWQTSYFQNPTGELGHVFESNAYDPEAQAWYTGDWEDRSIVKRWQYGDALDYFLRPAADYVTNLDPDTQPMLCWHPNLYGPGDGGLLAGSAEVSSAPRLVAWRASTGNPGTWETVTDSIQTGVTGTYKHQGSMVYVRSLDAVMFASFRTLRTITVGAGSGGALGTVTVIDSVPIPCQYPGASDVFNVGVLIDDPRGTGSPYILEKAGTNRAWRLVGGVWTVVGTHPFPRGAAVSSTLWTVASLYPYGVFWCLSQAVTGQQSFLWKPDF